jgi:hypothetical protein
LEIKGNFTQRSTYNYGNANYNFSARGTHKVLLSGSGIQTVSFEDYQNSKFNILVISKGLDTGYIFNFKPVWNSLMEMKDDIEPPTTPSNLVVQAKTCNSVSLSWSRSTDNLTVSKYQILRNGNIVGETASTSFIDTGLSPNTTYSYSVKACDGNGNASDSSIAVSVTTDEGTADLEYGEEYLEHVMSELGVTRSGNTFTWTGTDISGHTWPITSSDIQIKIVNGKEVVNVQDFENKLISDGFISVQMIALNPDGGGYGLCSVAYDPTEPDIVINKAVFNDKNYNNVVNIQKALVAAGCWIDANGYPLNTSTQYGKIDGIYGPKTRASLIKFQMDKMNLAYADIFYAGHQPTNDIPRLMVYKSTDATYYHVGVGNQTAIELVEYLGQGTGKPTLEALINKSLTGEYYREYVRAIPEASNANLPVIMYGVDVVSHYLTFVYDPNEMTLEEYINTMGPQWEAKWSQRTEEDVLNELQSALDLCGMIPIVGESADGVNAVIYWIRGDKANALISAGAMVFFAGSAYVGVRIAKRIENAREVKIFIEAAAEALETAISRLKAIGIADEAALAKISDNVAAAVSKGSKFTEATLPKGGVPRGVYEVPTGDAATIRSITRQNEAADLLAREGYDIEMLPYKVDGNGQGLIPSANPDYKILGEVFDCYSPNTSNVRNIWTTVQEKTLSQGRRIVLHLDDFTGSMDDLAKQFTDWPIDTLDELLVIKNGKIARLVIK